MKLLWALWLTAGGPVNSGYLQQVYVAAYFKTDTECQRVLEKVYPQARWGRCIQAEYEVMR